MLAIAGFIATSRASAAASTRPAWAAPGWRQAATSACCWSATFEGLDSERGIAGRAADWLAIRRFLHVGLEDATPDHSTISRTRRLIAVETHRAVFTWVQTQLVAQGLLTGKTLAVDATTLEANRPA